MKTKGVKKIFVDTNDLIYATNADSTWQAVAQKALEKSRQQHYEFVISQQVLREYLAGATRIRSLERAAFPLQDILENIRTFQTEFTVVQECATVLNQLLDLVQEIPVAGKQIHDANIVATMLVCGVQQLLTHNLDDFKRFATKIQVLPLEEWAASENDAG